VAAGKPAIAEGALRRALALRDEPSLRITLADSIASQGREDDAICEYKKVVDAAAGVAGPDEQHAIEQLVSLLKKVNRPEDAKKYAKKLRRGESDSSSK